MCLMRKLNPKTKRKPNVVKESTIEHGRIYDTKGRNVCVSVCLTVCVSVCLTVCYEISGDRYSVYVSFYVHCN